MTTAIPSFFRNRTSSAAVLSTALFLGLGFSATSVSAQSVATVPVGAVTVTIAASTNGTTYSLTQVSAPLLVSPSVPSGVSDPLLVPVSGKISGRISAVTTTNISVTGAGWVANELSQGGFPMFVSITSGVNAGKMFLVTANTDTAVTVNTQGADLATAGFNVGDSTGDGFEIIAGDTLLSIFGGPNDGVVGGTSSQFSANQTDRVSLNDPSNNSFFTYYFNTTNQKWQRAGSSTDQGNLVISPRAGIEYQRISTTPLTLTFLGRVPNAPSQQRIASLGVTAVARFYPTDTTLLDSGIQNIPGWRKVGASGITTDNCDRVLVKSGLNFFSYYYDSVSSTWKRAGTSLSQNLVTISAGGSLRIVRAGAVGQYDNWSQSLPYQL